MKKLISTRSKKNYLYDKIVIRYHFSITFEQDVEIKTFRYQNVKIKITPDSSRSKRIYWIDFAYTENINRLLKKYLKKKFDIKRTGTKSSHDTNFIPILYLNKALENEMTYEKLRKKGVDLYFKKSEKFLKKLLNSIQLKTQTEFTAYKNKQVSLSHIEVCKDIKTPKGILLVENKELRGAIQSAVKRISERNYYDSEGNSALKSVSSDQEHNGKEIRGYFVDNAEFKVYTKEITKTCVLNRFEFKVFKRKSLKAIVGNRIINGKEDFYNKLELVGLEFEKRIHESFNFTSKFTDKQKLKIIKSLCKEYFKQDYMDVYRRLTRPPQCINTGKLGDVSHRISSKVRAIVRDKGFIKKKKGTQPLYVIDFRFLQKQYLS